MENIKFEFEGKTYGIPEHAYGKVKFIILPNGRVVRVLAWTWNFKDSRQHKVDYPLQATVVEAETGEEIYWARGVE